MDSIYEQAKLAAQELCDAADLKPGDIMVVGCSSSEIAGGVIGHNSNVSAAFITPSSFVCLTARKRSGMLS